MGKTDTIKDRRVDVYVDSLERKERWSQIADEEGDSLSKFVQKCVEYALEQGGPDYAKLGEESKQIQELEQEVSDLRKDRKQKEIVIEQLESELTQHRMEPFLDDEYEGRRQYDQELIELLQTSDSITGKTLLRRLEIDPTDTELVKGVDSQLQQLEDYGLVKNTSSGWVWNE